MEWLELAENVYSVLVVKHVRNGSLVVLNHLTPNDLQRRRAVSPLKTKIPSKNMREKPTSTPIIHSFY
jgi:hypothetical protein